MSEICIILQVAGYTHFAHVGALVTQDFILVHVHTQIYIQYKWCWKNWNLWPDVQPI